MKKLLTFVIAVIISISAFAQKIKVRESRESIGGGSNNALVVNLYGINPSDAEDAFRSFMKQYDGKRSSQDGGIFIDNAVIRDVSGNNTVDVYGRANGKKGDKEITFIVAFNLGGAFLSSSEHSSEFKAAEKLVKEFAVKATKDAITEELKDAKKAQRKLEGDQQDLEKDNKGLHDDIDKYKGKIKKAEDDIVSNKADQEKKKAEIEAQKKVVADVETKLKSVD